MPVCTLEGSRALVGDANRPSAQPQFFHSCAAAKIHIVEVKIKNWIKQDFIVYQSGFFRGEKNTIQKFAFGRYRPIKNYRPEWMGSVSNAPAKIGLVTQRKFIVNI